MSAEGIELSHCLFYFKFFSPSWLCFQSSLREEKSCAMSLPFKGTTECSSNTLGIDGCSRNGLLTLSGVNCRLKHCSEALPERQVLKMHVRLKMLEQRKDDRHLVRHTSFTKAQCSGRSWIKQNCLKGHHHIQCSHIHSKYVQASAENFHHLIFILLFLLRVLYFWVCMTW